ncbi:MAG: ABC transporter permease [Bacteroidales bacterium]|nr:ABC transporter permease [Bacteroidales bacterium]MCF8343662.1 ABC transporter permease [Bacteroidales bacterium]MCF8351361.1 ABC transporter permease [Bacteroidales bacterium]MCF8377728.1 ABC transporter permease [Bacteroidales bacterium]
MLINYLKTSIRILLRQKSQTLINVLGLAIGFAVFILIMLFVHDQYSYDKFNEKRDRIYRLEFADWALLATIHPEMIWRDFPEVEDFVRMHTGIKTALINFEDQQLKVDHLVFADTSIFNIFTFEFIEGNPETALKNPFSVVLTESTAQRIFGEEDPLGKVIEYENAFDFKVTGIIKDPKNSHIEIGALANFIALKTIRNDPDFLKRTGSWNYPAYFLLSGNADADALTQKINKYFSSRVNWKDDDEMPQFNLRPLKEVYFETEIQAANTKQGNLQFVRIFLAVAVFILLIACINFINLSTAKSALRAKEIGVRKVVGSARRQLIAQFLTESVIISLFALLIALFFVELMMPVFRDMLNSGISLNYNPLLVVIMILGAVFIGMLAGLYPAFYLTSVKPVSIISGEGSKGKKGAAFRKALIVFQFSITIILLIGTLVVYSQLDYVKNKNLGFEKEHIIYLTLNRDIKKNLKSFNDRIENIPGVESLAYTSQVPGYITWTEGLQIEGERVAFRFAPVDPDYIPVLGIEMAEGRNFIENSESDMFDKYIINETAAKAFKWEEPIGQTFDNGYWDRGKVIGVVKDFHFKSLHSKIEPLVMRWHPGWHHTALIKLKPSSLPGVLDHIEKEWKAVTNEFPFEYNFLDKSYDKLYKSEQRFGKIFIYFSALAVFVACLGLFGLASFFAIQRTKEIGIRKVVGANTSGLVFLLIRDFTKWVLLANIIAWPLAYIWMGKWMQNFAYRKELISEYWAFIAAGLISLLIAVITVSWQAMRSASANPVDAIKYE